MNVDTAKLRKFLNEHFGPEDLRTFLFDYFRSVYDDLTDGLTKSRQIALLLEYCHKYKKFPDLLASIQQERTFFQPDDYVQSQRTATLPALVSDRTKPHTDFWLEDLDVIQPKMFEARREELQEIMQALNEYYSRLIKKSDIWVHPKTGMKMVNIPEGEFLFGENMELKYLEEFWIAKTPVTNGEYAQFVADEEVEAPRHWHTNSPPDDVIDHPVIYVSWYDAKAYAEWAEAELPTEEQWEKASRGWNGRRFPWGDDWHDGYCNTNVSQIEMTTKAGQFSPQGDSIFGCVDMSGNVWEWTRVRKFWDKKYRIVRGGSWKYGQKASQTNYSFYYPESTHNFDLGFRLVLSRNKR